MAAVFSPQPLSFASFPTLLVVTTLFRVGLEVSMTRLVLADADAGAVVRAFGSSVVAENLVVGIVVFAVITIVQLIVVARGAERVAEVSARFALDAMPGKQLAIDAELRTGAIDPDSARTRRAALERESQLYGAMDGAMRFVKGDAIAAIVIVVINLIGGLVIGIASRGMSAGEAAHTYSLLSIGAGLVAQIPSLLVAVASGLLVTRVASSGDRALGADRRRSARRRVRSPASRSCSSGSRSSPVCRSGRSSCSACSPPAARCSRCAARPRRVELSEPDAATTRGARLALRLSPALHDRARREAGGAARRCSRPRAKASTCRRSRSPATRRSARTRSSLAIDGTPVAWLSLAGDPLDALAQQLPAALAPLVPELLGVDRVAALVERTAAHAPVLVKEVIPRVVALPVLAEVLRQLARERRADRRPRRRARGDRARAAAGRRVHRRDRAGARRAPARPAAPPDHARAGRRAARSRSTRSTR